MSILILPKKEQDLIDTLDGMLGESQRLRATHAIEWYINYHYLRGCRYFDEVNYKTGEVVAFYEDAFGNLPFRYEDILSRYSTEVGRLQRIDIAPSVSQDGTGLEYAKKAAVAHVTLDSLMRGQPIDALKLEIAQMVCLYGTVGATNWVVQEPGAVEEFTNLPQVGSSVHIIEIVPPWELLPLPSQPVTTRAAHGICRQRWVPYEWLAELTAGGAPLKLPKIDDHDLQAQWASPSSLTVEDTPVGMPNAPKPAPETTPTRGGTSGGGAGAHRTETANVLLREVWIPSETGRLREYIVMAGRSLLFRKNYSVADKKDTAALMKAPVMPIAVATYTGGLGFFGRSFVGPLVSLNAEVESMLMALFRNVQDMDQFGYLFYPEAWGIPKDVIEEAKAGRRIFGYTPDPTMPNAGVQTFQPVNTGQMPGNVAQMGLQLADRLSQQPMDLMSGNMPGRAESGKSIDMLYQTSTVPLGGPATSIAELMTAMYKSILWNTKQWKALKVNTLSLLDDSVVGITLNLQKGEMELSENAIPDPSEVLITIRSKEPIDKDKKKMELIGMLNNKIITPREFRWINRRENLGLPTGNDVEWQNYVRAVINNILLFGDGVTPGKAFFSDYDIPSVHEYVILRRMASPEFALASGAVQSKFRDRLLELRAARGTLPNPAQYPEDAAAEADALNQQLMNQGGAAPGIPPELAGGMIQPGAGGPMAGPPGVPGAVGPQPGEGGFGPMGMPDAADVQQMVQMMQPSMEDKIRQMGG